MSKYGAYLAAAVIFFALAYAYCYPVLQGKVIYAGDNVNAEAAVHECEEFTRTTGEHSWWTGSMFGGMPNYQIGGGEYLGEKLLSPLRTVLHRGHAHTAWILIIYFFCFFTLLRSFEVDKWLSISGAVAIALSSYFIVIIAAGHNGKTSTIALMSVVMAGMCLIFRRKYLPGAILASLFTAVGFTMHPQMAYYLFMMMGLLWMAELAIHVREKRLRDFALGTLVFGASVALGFGACSSNVFANSEYASQTMRGGHSDLVKESSEAPSKGLDIAYATQWSYGIDETLSLLVPGVKGGSSSVNVGRDSRIYKSLVSHGVPRKSAEDFCSAVPMYWGEQPFTAGNVYVGAVVCLLFILGLLIVKGPCKWALLAATLFSVALAWGSNCMWLTRLFFNHFPLYNKFRSVSSILIVAEIAMPLLGFLSVKTLMESGDERKRLGRNVLAAAGITGGLCLALALLGGSLFTFTSSWDGQWAGSLPGWLYDAIRDERASLLRTDALRSAALIAAASAVLWLFSQGKMRREWLAAALGVLILVDMWPVDRRYLSADNFTTPRNADAAFAIQPWEQAVLADKDPHFRVFNLTTNTFNDARTSYRLKSLGGYHAAKLRRYQDLIDEHLSKMHMPVIDMLNAKYVIVSGEDGSPQPQLNPGALGNAWWVERLVPVEGANAESEALMSLDLGREAVVDATFRDAVDNLEPGIADDAAVRLLSYSPRALSYECSSSAPGVLVFSEIYYPFGWKASIDGSPAGHFRVNYMLRAMNVPAGRHTIEFVFDPDSVRRGNAIAVPCVIVVYLLLVAGIVTLIWRRKRSG